MTSGTRGLGATNNFTSLLAQRHQRLNALKLANSLQRLATGQRINRGADDPAGLIASEQLRSTLAKIDAEAHQLERANHQASTADGALKQVSDLLAEANALALANANGAGLSDLERRANQAQIDSILVTIDRVSRTTSFAGTKLLDGSFSLAVTNKTLDIDSTASGNLGRSQIDGTTYALADLKSGGRLETTSRGNLERAQTVLAAAGSQLTKLRGQIGAFQKHTIQSRRDSLDTAYVSLKSAESQIRDLDYAAEHAHMVRYELLHRASLGAVRLIHGQPRRGGLNLRA